MNERSAKREATESELKRVCYFRMSSQSSRLQLSQVNGNLCTHLILAFVQLDQRGNIVLFRQEDSNHLKEVAAFKLRYPHLRVLVSICSEQQEASQNGLAKAASCSDVRHHFSRSAIEFLQVYQLDGIDLNWRFANFPTTFMGNREFERIGLTKIIGSLRSAMVENFYARQAAEQQQQFRLYQNTHQTSESTVEQHLLTVAIAGQESLLKSGYELKQLANFCDWLNVMSFDYFLFKAYAPFTGPNSPLESIVEPYVPILGKLSLAWTINRLLEEGIAAEKLVMGIPTYARAYKLVFRSQQPSAFSLAVGTKGGGHCEDLLDYREVLDILARDDTVVDFDERARVPYLLTDHGYTWISFENSRSVREKVRHILERKLAGYMTWNLNCDDYLGASDGDSKQISAFPLHKAMLEEVETFRNLPN